MGYRLPTKLGASLSYIKGHTGRIFLVALFALFAGTAGFLLLSPSASAEVPSQPTRLAYKVSHNDLLLRWLGPVDNGGAPIEVTGYEVQRKLSSESDSSYAAVSYTKIPDAAPEYYRGFASAA